MDETTECHGKASDWRRGTLAGIGLLVLCRRAIHLIAKALDVDPTFLFS
jgi:hypothetical protein